MKIEDLNQLPLILIMYHSGSSGEFFAHALSQCLETVTHPAVTWENQSRCKFGDFFGRSLNGGSTVIDNNIMLDRIKLFFEDAVEVKQHHIGLSHPYPPSSIEFIKQYLSDIPVIEITITSEISRKFKFYAANAKIPASSRSYVPTTELLPSFQWPSVYQAHKQLSVEWADLIILDPAGEFNRIKQFLGITGNTDKFVSMIKDYRERNIDLLTYINTI